MSLSTSIPSAVAVFERELARPGRETLRLSFEGNARSLARFQASARAVAEEMARPENEPLRALFAAASAEQGKALEGQLVELLEGKKSSLPGVESMFPGATALLADPRTREVFSEYGEALAGYRVAVAVLNDQLKRPMNRNFAALLERIGPQAKEELSQHFGGQ